MALELSHELPLVVEIDQPEVDDGRVGLRHQVARLHDQVAVVAVSRTRKVEETDLGVLVVGDEVRDDEQVIVIMQVDVAEGGPVLSHPVRSRVEELDDRLELRFVPLQVDPWSLVGLDDGRKVPLAVAGTAPDAARVPSCPLCDSPMTMRLSRRGPTAGQRYWGCTRDPECLGRRPLQDPAAARPSTTTPKPALPKAILPRPTTPPTPTPSPTASPAAAASPAPSSSIARSTSTASPTIQPRTAAMPSRVARSSARGFLSKDRLSPDAVRALLGNAA